MSRFITLATVALVGQTAADSQPTRLRIVNGCSSAPMWIAHEAGSSTGPDPQNVKLDPSASHDFIVTDNLKATRYWPKMGCDKDGNGCTLGGSGGPEEKCPDEGCAPPIDTKFEATFGQVGQKCDPEGRQYAGCDWLDVSLVDGFTLPFKLELKGDCGGTSLANKVIDCSHLNYNECPTGENMGQAGSSVDLRVKNPKSGEVAGCYSPCGKLTFRNWNNTMAANHTPSDATAKDYCCPTPPETPEECRAGPVPKTEFVNLVHKQCPGVYGYSYDDGMGLTTCPAGTQYEVTFYCPGSALAHVNSNNLLVV